MLSPPKPIWRNSTKFVCEYWVTHMNGGCNVKLFLAMPPGALGRGQKVKYHLISITKSISRIFRTLTNWRFAVLNSHFLCWDSYFLKETYYNILLYCGTPTFWQRGLWDSYFQNPSESSDFSTKLCVCSHKWKIQNISGLIFILSPGSCPRGRTLGRLGCPGVKIIFFKHSMWHIKLTGMTSRTECK